MEADPKLTAGLFKFIKAAIGAHPAYRFATAVSGIAATLLFLSTYGRSAPYLVLGTIIFFTMMIAFLMFVVLVELSKTASGQPKNAALLFMWTSVVLIALSATATFTSAFFNRPLPFREWIVNKMELPKPPAVPVPEPESLDATYIGNVISTIGGREERSTARVHLRIGLSVVGGRYENSNGDSGTITGTYDGNSLQLKFSSDKTPGDCAMNATLSKDKDSLSGIYRCSSGDPASAEGAQVDLKRQQ